MVGRVTLSFAVLAFVSCAGGLGQTPDVGLSSVRSQRFDRPELPNANAGGSDLFGHSFAVGDFNGDGEDDLATGSPGSDGLAGAPVDECGQVVVRYGVQGGGLNEAIAPTILGQFLAGSTNGAEIDDWFGHALAACDLNLDGFDDLAVGVPGEDLFVPIDFSFPNAGVVEIFVGSPGGLVTPAATRLRDLTGTILAVANAFFGSSLACGDFNADGFADLAVGLPNRNVSTATNAGRVNLFRGGASPIIAGTQVIDQVGGSLGGVETDDLFGSALAAGDFNGDGFDDLAISVPGEDASPFFGAVQVLFGTTTGPSGTGPHILAGMDSGVGLSFGSALAAGDFDGDDHDDLVVGVSLDDTHASNSGRVLVLPGVSAGFDAAVALAPETILGSGESEPGERFGWALAVGDFDADGADDLAVGSPMRDVGNFGNGAVIVAMGVVGVGLEASPGRARLFSHGQEGIPGSPDESFVGFGKALASGDFDGDGFADLAVGAPDEIEAGLVDVGTVAILFGALFADGFESGAPDSWSASVPPF